MTTGRVASGHEILWPRHPLAPEATEQFTCHGKRHSLGHDGYAEVELNGAIRCIFLEWNGGTTRRKRHLTEKFQNYADYFSMQSETAARADFLIVRLTPQRESVIRRFVDSAFGVHQAKVEVLSVVATPGPAILIIRDAADLLRISNRTIRWLVRGDASPYLRAGQQTRFVRAELMSWAINRSYRW